MTEELGHDLKKAKFRNVKLRKDQEDALKVNRYGINKGYVVGRTPLRDVGLERTILKISIIPVPSLDPFWKIKNLHRTTNRASLNRSNEVPEKKLARFRDMATKTPGHTRMEVLKLIRKHPKNEHLYMICGVSTFHMLQNSVGNLEEIVLAMEMAMRDTAMSIITDGVSLFNLKSFFEVYFGFLEKLGTLQKRIFKKVQNQTHYGSLLKNLDYSVQITDLLLEKRKEAMGLVTLLSNNFNKTSIANPVFDFLTIKRAMDYTNAGVPQKKMDQGTAEQIIEYTFGIIKVLTKIPILEPIVSQLIKYLSSDKTDFRLQYVSILSNKFFFEFKLNMILRDLDHMRLVGRKIFMMNLNLLKGIPNRSVQKNYEFEPYLNIALITEFALNLYTKSEQEYMLSVSFKLLEKVTMLDQTEKRSFMTEAASLMRRLDHLMDADRTLNMDHSMDPFQPFAKAKEIEKKEEEDTKKKKKSRKTTEEPVVSIEDEVGSALPLPPPAPDEKPTFLAGLGALAKEKDKVKVKKEEDED